MASQKIYLLLVLLATHTLLHVSAAPPLTAPAFVWSNHRSFGIKSNGIMDYRVLSPRDLTDTLMQKLGWSNLLCSSDGDGEMVDTVLAFIGSQLHSEDLSHNTGINLDVLPILKDSFSFSNYSIALPYISVERPGIAAALFSSIKSSCSSKSRLGKIIVMGSCLRNSRWPALVDGVELVESVEDAKEFIDNRKTTPSQSKTDMIVACSSMEGILHEGAMLATLLSALHNSRTSNVVLYASNPLKVDTYQGRLLAANSSSSSSSNSTCDVFCETIVGVYEGVIVAVTLLIILISGLCCMMGIDSPTRFETARES